jgi:hypothetical protein
VQNQLISAPASILAPSDVDIPLRLNGVTPEQLVLSASTISSPQTRSNAQPDARTSGSPSNPLTDFPFSSLKIDVFMNFSGIPSRNA